MSAREDIHPFAVPIARAVILNLTGDGDPTKEKIEEVAAIISNAGQIHSVHAQLFYLRKEMLDASKRFDRALSGTGLFGR